MAYTHTAKAQSDIAYIRKWAALGFSKKQIAEIGTLSLSTVKRRVAEAGDISFEEHRGRRNHARTRANHAIAKAAAKSQPTPSEGLT